MYGLLAERAVHADGGSGPYVAAVGVSMLTLGGLAVTNFRGFADRCLTIGPGRRLTPGTARLVGGVFAVLGAVSLVVGIEQVARGEIGTFHRSAIMPLPMALVALLVMTLAMTRVWRRDDRVRRAWTAGGLRRVCAALLPLSVLGFVACTVLGYSGAGYLFWGTGAFAGITLLVTDGKDVQGADVEEERKTS
jgi:hypothetical protein